MTMLLSTQRRRGFTPYLPVVRLEAVLHGLERPQRFAAISR
jgi:hypothetical protein